MIFADFHHESIADGFTDGKINHGPEQMRVLSSITSTLPNRFEFSIL
jgi:hypothetical protein